MEKEVFVKHYVPSGDKIWQEAQMGLTSGTEYYQQNVQCVSLVYSSLKKFLKVRVPSATYFCSALNPQLGGSGNKQQHLCGTIKGISTCTLLLPSFVKTHKAVLEKRLNMGSHILNTYVYPVYAPLAYFHAISMEF